MLGLILLLDACDPGEGEIPEPTWFEADYDCVDGEGEVELPEGWPVLFQVYGRVTIEDEGNPELWWLYENTPDFAPGTTLRIPCRSSQDGGWVVYAHE